MSVPQDPISFTSIKVSNTFDGSAYTFLIICVYEREWIVSLNAQVSIHVSISGIVAKGSSAKLGERPCTESSTICLFKFDVKICCSYGVRSLKSLESRITSTSSGLQKKLSCLSVSFSNCLYLTVSYRWIP